MKKRFLTLLLGIVLLTSCNTSKEIIYFQDIVVNQPETISGARDITVQPKDQISIMVSSKDPQLAALFNLTRVQYRAGSTDLRTGSNNGEISGYTLDDKGDIDFPIIGTLHIAGMTKSQIAALVKKRLMEENLVNDPVVTVEFMNLYFSVLGEVKTPGKYAITKDQITHLEAISMAGDLSIYGKRDAIFVIREENGERVTHWVDIRSKDLFNSPVYYLKQNDVVYVQPNKVRAGQSTINENSVKSVSLWISIGSFLSSLGVFMVTHVTGKNTICLRWTYMKSSKEVTPNDETLRYYFYFVQERMNMFWRKVEGKFIYTEDPILRMYKFTNVYRATDRVSQYLIKNVIYKDIEQYTPEDVLLRILVFKIFNKIETWEFLENQLSEPICVNNFNPKIISGWLTKRQRKYPIFNNAYMMTGSHHLYNYLPTKHEKWLTMIKQEIIDSGLIVDILNAKTMEDVFRLLQGCSFLGSFLAYQYTIDMNYSPYINFSENDFVKAGIGAIRGIKKCFLCYGNKCEDAIWYVKEHFNDLQKRYGYTSFHPLLGHEPTLIDLQNCFCETDKYLRAKMPELRIGNVRIKQKYMPHTDPIQFFFPPKWNIVEMYKYKPIVVPTLFDL